MSPPQFDYSWVLWDPWLRMFLIFIFGLWILWIVSIFAMRYIDKIIYEKRFGSEPEKKKRKNRSKRRNRE